MTELFPVGYYLGQFPDVDPTSAANFEESAKTHSLIRAGWREYRLDRTILAEVWSMLAGSARRPTGSSWTRVDVASAYLGLIEERGVWQSVDLPNARDTTEADVHAAIDHLVEAGLAVELSTTDPATEQAMQQLTLRPMMVGLGNTAGAPQSYLIGVSDGPSVRVGPRTYDFWAAADDLATLWEACEEFAKVPDYAQLTGSPLSTPQGQMPLVLEDVRQLITYGSGYLDLPLTSGSLLPSQTDNRGGPAQR